MLFDWIGLGKGWTKSWSHSLLLAADRDLPWSVTSAAARPAKEASPRRVRSACAKFKVNGKLPTDKPNGGVVVHP